MKFFISLFVLLNSAIVSLAQSPILPSPEKYLSQPGSMFIEEKLMLDTSEIPIFVVDFIEDNFTRLFGMPIDKTRGVANITFDHVKNSLKDSYTIQIDANGIRIQYSTDRSALYAAVSLLQLTQKEDKGIVFQNCFVSDRPAFEWRGLHLDVSRHFYQVDEVKRFIDLMALYKFNKFHWHLTDDQGWRIEIKKYPLLTEVGAFRDSTLIGHYSDQPQKYDVREYGGYYTQEDIREIVEYASSKYIEIVPEIEMPGHSRAALAAYPELSCTRDSLPVPGTWGIFEDIYCSRTETIDFLKDVLAEVMELFPGDYIHIGGDEAPKDRWKKCSDCQKNIKDHQLKDEHELQSWFIGEIDAFITAHDKKLIGWDEILEGGLSPNAAVMSWRGENGGIEAAIQKHYAVMTPTTYCYFDYYQSSNENEPIAIGGFLPLEKVYKFDPVPSELKGTPEASYILGGQANLWTEYILDMKHLEYMTYPRAIALSQSVWCTNKPDYQTFLSTYLRWHEPLLDQLGVNYSRSIHYPELQVVRSDFGIGIHFSGAGDQYAFDVFAKEIGGHTMNGGQVMTKDDTLYFERTSGDKVCNFKLKVGSDKLEGTSEFNLKIHSAIGLPVELITQPHPKYNNNMGLNLVDGIKGKRPWKGSEWLGFNEKEIRLVIDRQEELDLNRLAIGLLKSEGQWIYLPKQAIIEGSNNNRKWKEIKTTSVHDENFTCELQGEYRYIRITFITLDKIPEGQQGAGHVPWTFIDEIELY